jgi:hypothetical protein
MTLIPQAPLPGQWTFWADLIIGAVPLGPVDVSSFSYTSKLSGYGTGSVTVMLPSGMDPARLLRLWSWRLWASYDGVPVWCGVPTGITDTGAVSVELTLTELTGYLTRRQMGVYPSKVYSQVEQTTIAADLASPLLDVGVAITTSAGGGFLRDRTYEYLEGDSRGELLTNLAGVISGPEFRAEYALTGTGPACTLRIAYPRVGSGAAGLGVSVPGPALDYQAAWDADQLRTRTYAVGDLPDGAAEGTPQPVSVVDRPQADLPRLDAVDDWTGTILTTSLAENANTSATQQAAPALTLTATPAVDFPSLATYAVGDDVTVTATDPLLPGGLYVPGRLTQLDVDAAAGTAAWTMVSTTPPPKARATLAGRLDRLDKMTRGIFHSGPLTGP